MIYYTLIFFITALASGCYGFLAPSSAYSDLAVGISGLFMIIAFAGFVLHTREAHRRNRP
ncbi:hypothetical protein Q4485_07220 [Granulosicoccaceae sp. 1_MG-2023]|nr:hypothetical protein [Granulosicoccaceae sp. 1_MG-2023]